MGWGQVVSALARATERDSAIGEALIVAGPRSCTLRELIDAVAAACGQTRCGPRLPLRPMLVLAAVFEDVCALLRITPPIYRRRMNFFHSDSEFDIARARRVLDCSPRVDLAERVRRTVEAYRARELLD